MNNYFDGYVIMKQLDKGASPIEKYELQKNGKKYLLRIYNAKFMSSRINAFNLMAKAKKHNVNLPIVYEYGILPNNKGFAILEWIDGVSLDTILNNYESEIEYGCLVADELIKLHQINAEKEINIYEKFIKTLENKFSRVIQLGIETDELLTLYDYACNTSGILNKLKKHSIIHGDFHPGNIVVDHSNKIWFIDLDVCKEAHSWEEFSSNACNMDFPNFYSSVIINYFKGDIPNDFWKVYNLYGCIYVLDYFLYLTRIKNKSLAEGKDVLNEFLKYNQNFQIEEPKWFNRDIKVRRKIK